MLAAFRMIDRKQLAFHLRATRFDAGMIIATALAAVVISVEFCIVIGVFLSFVFYVPRAAQVRMAQVTLTPEQITRERLPGDLQSDRLLFFGLEGELFFGAEPELDKHFGAIEQAIHAEIRVVILALNQARNPDAAFFKLLQAFQTRLQQRNVVLLLCGVRPDLSKALADAGLEAHIGKRHIFSDGLDQISSTRDAVYFAHNLLGGDGFSSTKPERVS